MRPPWPQKTAAPKLPPETPADRKDVARERYGVAATTIFELREQRPQSSTPARISATVGRHDHDRHGIAAGLE